jgi:hypothetical protein
MNPPEAKIGLSKLQAAAALLLVFLALLATPGCPLIPAPRELPRADGATGRPWITGSFAPPAGYHDLADPLRLERVQRATSFTDGDRATGRAESAWFRTSQPVVRVALAGYPGNPGLSVRAEFRDAAGAIRAIAYNGPDPRETWREWSLPRPEGAVAVRVVAEDGSRETFGWVAISHPYRSWPGWIPRAISLLRPLALAALLALLIGAAQAGTAFVTDRRILIGTLVAGAVLLALRKPWALHTPQLWAEDGSIFLVQDGQLGIRAWFEPYNGYLHLLPRLVAWIARQTADVAWWPAIYNGGAFAVTVGLFARLASARVRLPAKPALLLTFPLVVGTGEVLINLTNLQWLTAFFLVLHLFLEPPKGASQRAVDLLILVIVGLNGPFAAVLAPLFAWRAWRDRRLDDILALAVVGTCALIQGAFASRAGLALYGAGEPLRLLMFISVLGSRLVTWTFFGPGAVRALPLWAHAAVGIAFVATLAAIALRRHEERPMKVMLLGALGLMTAACAWRVRADLWQDDTLVNGDRYFHISRVLVAWLVILEMRAACRVTAWTARGLCALGVALHLPHFVIPAPPDYRWSENCDPIRRGTPARINTLPEGWYIEYPGRPASP